MEKEKKALLILIGGRQTPNILTALFLRPEIIIPIASHEALSNDREWSQVKDELESICPNGLKEPVPVDAFDIEQIKTECRNAVVNNPDYKWIFNLTCGSKIMGFGAFEIVKEINASSWYLTTDRVITLSGNKPNGNLFKIDVENYFAGYGRKCVFSSDPNTNLISFSKYLASKSANAMKFRDTLRNSGFNSLKKGQVKTETLRSQASYINDFCQKSKQFGLMSSFQRLGNNFEVTASGELFKFFNGDWLEYYVYSIAKELNCFDDVKFGVKIPSMSGENELDLAATNSSSLLIGECKTEKDLKTDNLDKLSSVANLIGGNYVGRLFITSLVINEDDSDAVKSYNSFLGQAQARRIIVVTGKDLPNLSKILTQETTNPIFQRG